jgi:spore coat polysaccharide biosynthesis predicted glycosyltransferase SpsG
MEAAMRAGWAFRYDPVRDEFTAARELHTSRKIGDLLDEIGVPG